MSATTPSASKDSQDPHATRHHGPSLGMYFGIWIVLLMLTSLTFAVSQLAPPSVHLPAAVLIAATKATLVAAFFMHLKYSSGAMRLSLILSVGFVLLLMGGILADIHTRPPMTNSNDSVLAGKDVAARSVQAREAYGPPPPVVHVEEEPH